MHPAYHPVAPTPEALEILHKHLTAGGQAVICTYTRTQVLNHRCVDYIRLSKDGRGFWAGWPGRHAEYIRPGYLFLVDGDYRIETGCRRRRSRRG